MAFSGPYGGGASGPFYKKATLFVGRHGFRTLRRTRAAFFVSCGGEPREVSWNCKRTYGRSARKAQGMSSERSVCLL